MIRRGLCATFASLQKDLTQVQVVGYREIGKIMQDPAAREPFK
jgi:hypothetical protein